MYSLNCLMELKNKNFKSQLILLSKNLLKINLLQLLGKLPAKFSLFMLGNKWI